MRRAWRPGLPTVTYCVFDVLAIERKPLLSEPVEVRKARLAELLQVPIPSTMYVGHFDAEHSEQLLASARALELEGLVAKRLGSPYQPGVRTTDWAKIRVNGVPPARFKR